MLPGRKQRASVPMLPKTAIHGGFSLGMYHFISEIAAFLSIALKPNAAWAKDPARCAAHEN